MSRYDMKKVVVIFMLFIMVIPSCKKKEKFLEPEIILRKWAGAIERLDYFEYRKCEAYPKEKDVFREMYQDFYLSGLSVVTIGPLSEKDINKDPDGNPYIKRNVVFECKQVRRRDRKVQHPIKGEVFFIRFVEGERKKEGWLMANRTLMHIPQE